MRLADCACLFLPRNVVVFGGPDELFVLAIVLILDGLVHFPAHRAELNNLNKSQPIKNAVLVVSRDVAKHGKTHI